MYLTDEEREQLMTLLHDIRRDEPPVRYSAIKTQAEKEYKAAVKREAQGALEAHQCKVAKALTNTSLLPMVQGFFFICLSIMVM